MRSGATRSFRAGALTRGAVAVLLAVAATASAQPAARSADVETRRRTLYSEGVEAATKGRWAEAKERFGAVLAIRTSAKVLFSLAQAEEQLGQVASASADYGRALEAAKGAGESDVVVAADQARSAIAPRVPHLTVVAAGAGAAAAGAKATLDGEPIPLGAPLALDPGTHQLVLSAQGVAPSTRSIVLAEGQKLEVSVPLTGATPPAESTGAASAPPPASAAPPSPSPEEPPAAEGASPWPTAGLIAAGAGVVALGVGTYFGIDARSKNDQSYSSGCTGDACTAGGAQTRRDALSAANASTIAFVVGGVLTAGGVALWLLAPRHPGEPHVALAPVAFGSGAGGLLMSGSWR